MFKKRLTVCSYISRLVSFNFKSNLQNSGKKHNKNTKKVSLRLYSFWRYMQCFFGTPTSPPLETQILKSGTQKKPSYQPESQLTLMAFQAFLASQNLSVFMGCFFSDEKLILSSAVSVGKIPVSKEDFTHKPFLHDVCLFQHIWKQINRWFIFIELPKKSPVFLIWR